MATGSRNATPRRIAIVGAGVSGLAAAWALNHHRDRFDFRLFEARDRIGGNAVTADMPQADGGSIPFDISEITYIMHNQQPWAGRSDKPCLVTYNPVNKIDERKIVGRWWFQHIVHDVRHVTLLVPLFRFIQGRRRTWHCGAHTLVNSQETCFVSGLAAATQIGADYPFGDPDARRWFNHYGSIMHGRRFRKAKG